MKLIGRPGSRYATEAYPSPPSGAVSALQNRKVAAGPILLTTPFTPGTTPGSLVAATLFTPRVSGTIQVAASLDVINGATPDTYGLVAIVSSGTSLTVSGGESSSNDWFVGTNTPPVVGGSGITPVQVIDEPIAAIAASGQGNLSIFGFSQPLPVGVPVVIEIFLVEIGGGNPLATVAFFQLSVLELP